MRFNRIIFIGTLILFIAIVAAAIFGYLLSHFIQGFLPVDAFTFLIAIFLVVAVALLIYGLFLLVKRQQSPPSSRRQPPEPIELPVEEPFIRRKRRSPSYPSPADLELENRLISMLAGDRAAAERLVSRLKQNHPDMPENWYWQRAIDDVARDRL